MPFFMRVLSTALLFSFLVAPLFTIAQTTTAQTASQQLMNTARVAPSNSPSANRSNSSSGGSSNALLYSGLGLGGLLGVAYLLNLFSGGAAAATIVASAIPKFPFSFGGHVVKVIPCVNGALWVMIRSLRGVVPTLEPYIWTPLTITHLVGPPKIINEGVLGIADVPFVCVTPLAVPLWGFRMTIVGTSGFPQF